MNSRTEWYDDNEPFIDVMGSCHAVSIPHASPKALKVLGFGELTQSPSVDKNTTVRKDRQGGNEGYWSKAATKTRSMWGIHS